MSGKSEQRERLLTLIRERSFRRGPIKLSSGVESDVYIDGKMVELLPEGAHLIGEVVYDEIKDEDFDAIGGLAVGAVPMVTSAVISFYHHGKRIEGVFVRPEPKSHGTRNVVEGKLSPGARVVIVDDVVTSGKSVIQAIEAVEQEGAKVELVLSIVDRQAGADELFRNRNIRYAWIFTKDEVAEAVHAAT